MIVGIDPGTTTAVAVLDFFGNVLLLESRKGMGRDEVVEMILEKGKPVIVSTDRSKPPATVEKIRSSFEAVLVRPKKDLSSLEKERLVPKGVKIKNKHERDALVSAILAFRKFSQLFARVEKVAGRDSEAVKELVLTGVCPNIAEAVGKGKIY